MRLSVRNKQETDKQIVGFALLMEFADSKEKTVETPALLLNMRQNSLNILMFSYVEVLQKKNPVVLSQFTKKDKNNPKIPCLPLGRVPPVTETRTHSGFFLCIRFVRTYKHDLHAW